MTPLEIIRQKKISAATNPVVACEPLVATLTATLDAARPCPSCSSPLFWLAGKNPPTLRCAGCQPPPSMIFAKIWLAAVVDVTKTPRQWMWERIKPRFDLSRRRKPSN